MSSLEVSSAADDNGSSANDSVDGMDQQTESSAIIDDVPSSNAEPVGNDNHISEDKHEETESSNTISGMETVPELQTTNKSSVAGMNEDAEMDTDNDVNESCLGDEVDGTKRNTEQGENSHEKLDCVTGEKLGISTEAVERNEELTTTDQDKKNCKEMDKDEEVPLNKTCDTLDLQTEGTTENKTLDLSTGENEFSKFLTQIPADLDGSMVDDDAGIVIDDKDIIKAEDVLGRGKRSRTPRTDSIYTSSMDDDPDYDPSISDRAQKYIKDSKAKQTQQLASNSNQIQKGWCGYVILF